MQLPALRGIGEDGVGRDPAQEYLYQLGGKGAFGVEGAVGQVVAVTPLDQQLQRHLVAVYLEPAHRLRDELVKGPPPQPEHLLLLEAVLPCPVRQPALLHHHAHVVRRVGVVGLMDPGHFSPIDPHRHVPLLLRHHRQCPFVRHHVKLHLVPQGFIDGSNHIQIDPLAVPVTEAGPVVAIDVYGVCPHERGDQQATEQKKTNHDYPQ